MQIRRVPPSLSKHSSTNTMVWGWRTHTRPQQQPKKNDRRGKLPNQRRVNCECVYAGTLISVWNEQMIMLMMDTKLMCIFDGGSVAIYSHYLWLCSVQCASLIGVDLACFATHSHLRHDQNKHLIETEIYWNVHEHKYGCCCCTPSNNITAQHDTYSVHFRSV